MKIEMKMKTRLLLTLNASWLIGLTTLNAAELGLQADEMWSVDGGVFHHASDHMPTAGTLPGKVLIKNSSGAIRIVELGQGLTATTEPTHISVDRTAPVIADEWQAAIISPDGVIIGPNSKLTISVNEAELKGIEVDGDALVINGLSHDRAFDQPVESVVVVAEDDYHNVSQKTFHLQADYQAPEVKWTLMSPAIQSDGIWYAGDQAVLKLSASDNNGISAVKLNEQKVAWQDTSLQVNAGDVIHVSDALGNTNSVPIKWQKDSTEPVLKLQVNGQSMASQKRVTVRVNDLIEVQTVDDGVGVNEQQYKGKSRKWLPLPKKFRFTSKGSYRIQIYSEDLVGNKLETYLKFKVKR